jgi:hypothetical protein
MASPELEALLTAREKEELELRPVSRNYQPFTAEQLAVRVSIGKKIALYLDEVPDWARPIHEETPMWAFYMDGDNPRRVYGVARLQGVENGTTIPAVHSASFLKIMGGLYISQPIPCSELRRVDAWDESVLAKLKTGKGGGIMADPLGYELLKMDEA